MAREKIYCRLAGSFEKYRHGFRQWTDKLGERNCKKTGERFDRSISFQWTLFEIGWFAGPLGCLVPNHRFATLLMFASFDRIKALTEPGFLGPLPVLIGA